MPTEPRPPLSRAFSGQRPAHHFPPSIAAPPGRRQPLVSRRLEERAAGRTGFAHLFEHMLFQGSEHIKTNQHFHYIQQVGGVANGSTWFDRTKLLRDPARPPPGPSGCGWSRDRMGFLLPAITAENLETQRVVVMNERRQRVD